jgi:hypothetical protein
MIAAAAAGLDETFEVDASCWPVVRARPALSFATTNALSGFLDEISRLHERGPLGVVYDVPRFALPNAGQRKLIADWSRHTQATYPRRLRCVALATVGNTATQVLGGVVRGIGWLAPADQPVRIFKDVDEALVWAHSFFVR